MNSAVTDRHLTALGRITLEFARLEQFMSHFMWSLIAPDSIIGSTITTPMPFGQRLSLFRSLFHMLTERGIEADVTTFDAILGRIEDAVGRRNRITHALIWHPGRDGDLAFSALKRNAKGSARWVAQSASVAELNAVAEAIYKCVVELSDFMTKHFGGSTFPPRGGKGTIYRGWRRPSKTRSK